MRPLHEILLADINYQIEDARKNAATHNARALTLEHLKDLFERRIKDYETASLNEQIRSQADGSGESGK